MTHTITLPVATLAPDADKHSRARVVVSALGRKEIAYANNEFTLVLGGVVRCTLRGSPRA
ncbi:MAG: hypothetical protein IJU12_05140 [Clostridia bacterium]|nr:hypothetical protein [Clostridia bacterium]